MRQTKLTSHSIEKRTLLIGAFINLIMAFSGWIAYYLSNSQALLLDGNFSFVIFLSLLVAIKVSAIKSIKSDLFPFGQFVFESLYSLVKGVLIVGVLLVALTDNTSKIFHFINGQEIQPIKTNIVFTYSLLMTGLCFGSAYYYKKQNSKIDNSSPILRAEHMAAVIDGFMSAGIGIALIGVSFLNPESHLGFLNYIGDAILVVILALLLGKEPFTIIRDSFIEISGGTLQNKEEKNKIETILNNHLPSDELLIKSYITKTGSSYLVVAYLSAEQLDKLGLNKSKEMKELIIKDLNDNYQNLFFEMVLE